MTTCPRCGWTDDPAPWTACLQALLERGAPAYVVRRLVATAEAVGYERRGDEFVAARPDARPRPTEERNLAEVERVGHPPSPRAGGGR